MINEKSEDQVGTIIKDASEALLKQISKSSVGKESSDDQVGRISRYHNRPDSGASVVTKLNMAKIHQNLVVATDLSEPNLTKMEIVEQSPD